MSRFVASLSGLPPQRVQEFFDREPETHHYLFGAVSRVKPSSSGVRSIYVDESSDGTILGMALIQPRVVLVSTFENQNHVHDFSSHVRAHPWFHSVRELMGPAREVDALWSSWQDEMSLRGVQPNLLHRLERLSDRPRGDGVGFRFSHRRDQDWIREWMRAFAREAFHPADEQSSSRLDAEVNALAQSGAFGVLFDERDQRPVSVGAIRETYGRYYRMVYVFTPEIYRGRGFAERAAWEIAREIHVQRRGEAVLFTDRENETAKRIYARIGFRQGGDFNRYLFTPARTAQSTSRGSS